MTAPGETLIGRSVELKRVDHALDALDGAGPGCIAIEGEPGIGKTRLLSELRRRAEERGQIALHGQAAEFERDRPFGVLIEAIDPYISAQLDNGLATMPDELAEELAATFPSMRGAGAAPAVVGDERYRAHRAVRALLEQLAEAKPLVIALDDLHWADEATIELLGALLRRAPDAPVLLALGFRPGSAPERLTAALAAPLATRIELTQLSETEASALLGEIDAGSRAAIYRHAGGNPFYLEQLARLEQPLELDQADPGQATAGVPAGVAASLAEEIGELSGDARRLLDGAAVAGEPFDPALAGEIAELDPAETLAALDGLLDRDLIRPTDVPRRFIFRHPLVRRTVYESIGGGSKLAAHGRAAAGLAARGAAAAERAHHVEQAAGQGDSEAIEVLLEAADAAAGRAPAVAARWLDGALRLLPDGDQRQVSVRIALASALRSTGELERCREILLETIELVGSGDEARRIELTAWCAAVEHWLGRHEDAHLRLIRAWDELADQRTPESAALQIELAIDGLYTLDYEQTRTMGAGALETARAVGDPALIALAAAAASLGEATEGLIGPAREHHAEAVELLDRLPDDELAPRLDAFYYIAWAENYLELYDEALAHIDRGIEIARATGEGRLLIPLMLSKGYPLEAQGRLKEAAEVCEAAVEAARLSANRHYLFWALFELAWPRYFAGDLEGAIEACEESLRYGDRLTGGTIPSAGGGPGWALGVALFTSGEKARGLEAMRALGSEEIEFAVPVERCFDWEMFALAELDAGNVEAANAHAERARELSAGLDLQLPAALASRTRAAILLATGDAEGAIEPAREGVDGAIAAGAGLQAAYSRELLGRALAAADRREEAIEELREAERELDAFGAHRERDATRRELRKLGVRREARGPAAGESGVASLTKRELEISNLVTDRKTNKEIAAELFLSEKTVESHLRNIFFKLGTSTRVQVAKAIEHERDEQPAASA